MKKEIGLRIRAIREKMNLTKEEFSKKIGISSQYLGMIEKGRNNISIETLKLLCDYTNLSADYILFGKEKNLTNETKELLKNFTNEQIENGCKMLKNLAVFIKSA